MAPPATKSRTQLRDRVIANIHTIIDASGEVYNQSRIEQAVDRCMREKPDADEKELNKAAYKWLKSHASDKRSKARKPAGMDDTHQAMANFLLQV